MMRRITIAMALLGMAMAHAQVPAVPSWMQGYFAEGATTTLPESEPHPVKHNTFIGSYTARLTIQTPEGIAQQLFLSAGQDRMRSMTFSHR